MERTQVQSKNFKSQKIVIINGVSGAGKTTLLKFIMKQPQIQEQFGFSVSYTTRNKREHETDGKEYFFVSEEEFQRLVDENAFIEYAEVHGHRYGTSVKEIQRILMEKNVLLDIDFKGMQALKQMPDYNDKIFAIAILPPSQEIVEQRLRKRGTETEEEIQVRLCTADREKDFFTNNKNYYEYQIVNDDLEETQQTFLGLILGIVQ